MAEEIAEASQRVALVTGANRGIGLEIARQLLSLGFRVLATARSQESLHAMHDSLSSCGDVTVGLLDVTSDDSVQQLVSWVRDSYGRLDVLINNAGIAPDLWKSELTLDLGIMRSTMETNLFGVMRCCVAFLPFMREGGYGRVVNISSELASSDAMDMDSAIAYRTSKAALNTLTRLLAQQLKDTPNIKINAACPGWVRTDLGGPEAIFSVEEGADTPVWLATLPADGASGGLFRLREAYPW